MNLQQLWQAALGELELLLSKANFTTWFKNTSISSFDNEKITIAVPNGFTKTWFETKYHQAIIKALRNVTQGKIKEVVYKIETTMVAQNFISQKVEEVVVSQPTVAITPNMDIPLSSNNFTPSSSATSTTVNHPYSSGESTQLNPRYSFSHFIVGKNNELAHAAALAVAKNPGQAYNPLFIYGGVGLGKTHLMQAIAHKILENNPKANIVYVSCEKFTNDFIGSLQQGKTAEFHKKYRSADVLLVDDIQFMSGKEQTQEAFFHTFNELHQQNKQVVLTSDRPPKAIATLEHRLISRFEWGMIADISSPDLETKIAIIETKAREKNYNIKAEVSSYLATAIHNNIRELEGALNRIIAHIQLQNKELTLDEIKQITSSITTNANRQSLTPKHIITTVAQYFDIEIADITGSCRKKNLAGPRQIIMYIMREEMKASYPVIGQEIGGRDHTTAIHAYEKIVTNLKTDEKLRQDINTIKQRLVNC